MFSAGRDTLPLIFDSNATVNLRTLSIGPALLILGATAKPADTAATATATVATASGTASGTAIVATADAQAPIAWYRRSKALDITGTNPRDSVVLTATGRRADSLSIVMTFYVAGALVHRRQWNSEDELYEREELRLSRAKLDRFMRTRLDTIVTLVKRQPINREQVAEMGDEAVLRRIVPRPTHQLIMSFAFESSEFLAWDPRRRRLVVFMECC